MWLHSRVVWMALVLALSVSGCAAMPDETGVGYDLGEVVPDELVVMFAPETTEARRDEIHRSAGGQVLTMMLGGRIAQVKVRQDQSVGDLETAYRGFAEVESVEPNYLVQMEPHQEGRP